MIVTPGATSPMLLDVFENNARVYGPSFALFWIAPTAITPGLAAGY